MQAAALSAASPWNNDSQEESQMQKSRIYICDPAVAHSHLLRQALALFWYQVFSPLLCNFHYFFFFSQVHLGSCCNHHSYPISSAQILVTIYNYPWFIQTTFLCIPSLTTSSDFFHFSSGKWWYLRTCYNGGISYACKDIRNVKKEMCLCYIYQSKRMNLWMCLPYLDGGNKRGELTFSSFISVGLHGILHRILHFNHPWENW